MKIGDIAYRIYTTTILLVASPAIAYYLVIVPSFTAIQDKIHNFGRPVEAGNVKVWYMGVEPYDPLPFSARDKDGHAEVKLKGNERAFLKYDNLTAPSLEGKIMVIDSKGKEVEFNEEGEYDPKTREEVEELKRASGSPFDSSRSIADIVEEEIRQAIAGR